MSAKVLCVVDRQRAAAGRAVIDAVKRALRMAGFACSLEIVDDRGFDRAIDGSIAGIVAFGEAAAECARTALGTTGNTEPMVVVVGAPATWRGDVRTKRASWLELRWLLCQLRDTTRAHIDACPGHAHAGA